MPAFPSDPMSCETLLDRLGDPDAPLVADLRIAEDIRTDPVEIPGALRHDETELPALARRLGGRPVVILCHKGLKISQGAAAWLRSAGLDARHLDGGMVRWRALPGHVVASRDAAPRSEAWVAPRHPDAATLQAAWLLRRFVDREARFLFVARDALRPVAERFLAEMLPSPAALRSRFGLGIPALSAVDAGLPALAPLFDGLALRHAGDARRLEAALPLFDALLAGARAPVAA